MPQHPIHTMGHGTRKSSELLDLLKKFSIDFLLDVRSRPYSKFNPQFNREGLTAFLEQHGIKYVYMGDTLGGRPSDPTCYNANGKIDYTVLRQKESFRKGIERIRTAYEKNLKVALMCSESRPGQCHRSKLIGSVLYEEKIGIRHIDENGEAADQDPISRNAHSLQGTLLSV